MRFLPLGIDLRGRPCLVVGGGAVATRKVRTLLEARADVAVVAPELSSGLASEVAAGRVHWLRETFREQHLEGVFLAVLATDDRALNAAAARSATGRGVLACDASSAERSRVIFGALLEQDGAVIAAFTDGQDPALARRTRDAIATVLPAQETAAREQPAPEGLLVLAAHGSRNDAWAGPLEALTAAVASESGAAVRLAYVQLASPTLEEVVEEAAASGVRRIRVLPLFMTGTGHVERDIRPVVARLERAHPEVELRLLAPVGEQALFRQALVQMARETTV